MSEIVTNKETIPKYVFLIPYRGRPLQLDFFQRHMKYILEDYPEGETQIFFVHQLDERSFNRGGMKNIGFLVVKELYPHDYKNITLIFNDLDTLPYVKNFLNYQTKRGYIKHFYGVKHTLGGIFTIKAGDYELINGFPNLWAWGYEDNMIYNRAIANKIKIDRSVFFPMHDGNIIHLSNGTDREVNHSEFERYMNNTREGIDSISELSYEINDHMIDVKYFSTGREENARTRRVHDLKKGTIPFHSIRSRNRNSTTMTLKMI